MKAGVVVVAAGRGLRFGGTVPKQFLKICGKPLVWWSLSTFNKLKIISEIVLVIPRGYLRRTEQMAAGWNLPKLKRIITGGTLRVDSVYKGVAALSGDVDVILVHDGARPLISAKLVESVADAAAAYGVALPGLPVGDTLKETGPDLWVKKTFPRKGLWSVQTPQAFSRNAVARIFNKNENLRDLHKDVTDDVQLAERKGVPVKIVPGSPFNIKVTYPDDVKLCSAILKAEQCND